VTFGKADRVHVHLDVQRNDGSADGANRGERVSDLEPVHAELDGRSVTGRPLSIDGRLL
jgi:hypothetical protein